jgi:YlmC/YmxH family sporulation protein
MTFRELCKKQVIQLEQGACLGKIDDLTFDPSGATIQSVVMLGRPKLFGLLGREESLTIPWEDIEKIGLDAVLIRTPLPHSEEDPASDPPSKTGFWGKLFGSSGH